MTVALLSPEQVRLGERVDALDLEPIAFKLMHPEPGETGMTLAEADQLIALYRGFLKLCGWYSNPHAPIVPSRAVDEVWHTHILDTAKYAVDCTAVFGYFLHHYPYSGMGGAADEAAWRANSARSQELFRHHFGTDLTAGLNPVWGGNGPDCDDGAGTMCTNHCDEGDSAYSPRVRPRPDRQPVLA